MMNLIPPQGQKVVQREYVLRVTATLAMLFGAVGIVLAIGCVPVYVLVNAQIEALASVTEKERAEAGSIAEAEEEIRITKEILAQLHSASQGVPASELLREVEHLAPDGILFKSFTMGYDKGIARTMTVQGVAVTRETLIRFKKAVESGNMFESAEVPIAELAKDTNLPFTMTVTLTSPQ